MPFITFTYKATPLVAKTLIEKPAVIGKYGLIKRGLEKLSPQDQLAKEREAEPDYIRKGFYVRMPMEDQFGRALYFDMTYILPFGDLISGNIFEGAKSGQSLAGAALSKFPALNMIGELYSNEDFFGNPIIKATSTDPMEVGRDVLGYLINAYGPPPFTQTPSRLIQATQLGGMKPEEVGQKRTITEEVLRNFGLKVQPFKLEQQQGAREREARDALQELLKEKGEIREKTIPYIPKKQGGSILGR